MITKDDVRRFSEELSELLLSYDLMVDPGEAIELRSLEDDRFHLSVDYEEEGKRPTIYFSLAFK